MLDPLVPSFSSLCILKPAWPMHAYFLLLYLCSVVALTPQMLCILLVIDTERKSLSAFPMVKSWSTIYASQWCCQVGQNQCGKTSESCTYTVAHTTLQKPYVHNQLDGVWRQWTLLTSYSVAYKLHKMVLQKHCSQSTTKVVLTAWLW